MKNCGRLACLLGLVFMSCSGCHGESSSPLSNGIEGVITVSPAHPGPSREDVSNAAPLANAVFTVEDEKGVVASFVTDEQGRFHISLGPGHYLVKLTEPKIRRCGPFEADVAAGKMTAVTWRCDSGMR
jgi:hypothetical protein